MIFNCCFFQVYDATGAFSKLHKEIRDLAAGYGLLLDKVSGLVCSWSKLSWMPFVGAEMP